jgi:asparagine synthase (glutamine-hydrolysing)
MANEDDSLWLTFNGEIYNYRALRQVLEEAGHRFKSQTDTEVILHGYEEWGPECVHHFDGMFAFALWDCRRRRLFLARDHLGIKPLYYAFVDDALVFASEPKALLRVPGFKRQIAPGALASFLFHRYVAGEQSIYQGVKRLLPGNWLIYDEGRQKTTVECYWKIPTAVTPWKWEDACGRFQELMSSAVQSQMVSDVPLGVFLSGGLDSSVIAASAARHHSGLNTFSIGFQGWEQDELAIAARTAKVLQTCHHEDVLQTDTLAQLMSVFDYLDEPLGDTSIFPTSLICMAARKHVTVALSGDGGDEVFGGYNWYWQTVDCSPRKQVAFRLYPCLKSLHLQHTKPGLRCSPFAHYHMLMGNGFSYAHMRRLFPGSDFPEYGRHTTRLYEQHYVPELPPYRRWQYVDMHSFLVDNNLFKTDRLSMAHGLEMRVPLLDRELVEFAFSLPPGFSMQGHDTKRLLRQQLAGMGCQHLLTEKKRGFSCPINLYWPQEQMWNSVRHGCLVSEGIVDRRALDDIGQQPPGLSNYQIWLLAVLEQWFKRWML